MKVFQIAIDGPAGAGKSTLAKAIASKLGILYLDTGAMYRAMAYFALSRGVAADDVVRVIELLPELNMEIGHEDGVQKVIVNGVDVTGFIREHSISMAASTISKIPEVRVKLVELQREIASKQSCVLDGRDIGSYVLPDAPFKFFLTATAEERAKRRFEELTQKGEKIAYEEVLVDIVARDKQDTTRAFAPLVKTEDAILVDTTKLTVDEVIAYILKIIEG